MRYICTKINGHTKYKIFAADFVHLARFSEVAEVDLVCVDGVMETESPQNKCSRSIQAVDRGTVHRICSGQVSALIEEWGGACHQHLLCDRLS